MKASALVVCSILVVVLIASELLVSPIAAASRPIWHPQTVAHPTPAVQRARVSTLTFQQSALAALFWMQTQQNPDGSQADSVGSTCDATLAYVSAGYDPATAHSLFSTTSAVAYLEANAKTYAVATSPDQAGKLAMTVKAADLDPANFAGLNLITTIESYYSTTTNSFVGPDPGDSWYQSFPILGLVADGNPAPTEVAGSALALRALQQPDGGWSYDTAYPFSDPSSTGIALEALAASGANPTTDPAIVKGKSWLKSNQDSTGGWPVANASLFQYPDANDTAYAIQGLLATGENLTASWSQNGVSPYQALQTYQNPDGAFFWSASYSTADNGLATWQAVPALLGVSYPYVPKSALIPFPSLTIQAFLPVAANNGAP